MTVSCDKDAIPVIKDYNYSGFGGIPTTAYAIDFTFNNDVTAKFNFRF